MEKKKKKKKWIRPEIVRVELAPEEAVLTGCKMKNTTGPNDPFHCAHGNTACYNVAS